jgi:hypothetical protein
VVTVAAAAVVVVVEVAAVWEAVLPLQVRRQMPRGQQQVQHRRYTWRQSIRAIAYLKYLQTLLPMQPAS